MEKKVLYKKLRRKYFSPKLTMFKQYCDNIVKQYKFLREILDTNHLNLSKQSSCDILANLDKADECINLYFKQKSFWKLTRFYEFFYKKLLEYNRNLRECANILYLKPCQEKFLRNYQLETVAYVKGVTDFFDENNLEYFITSGTLLGAIRHQGFIPWDDDMDVGMMRKDYEKLKLILKDKFICADISKIYASKNNKHDVVANALKKNPNQWVSFIGHRYIQIIKGTNLKDYFVIDIFPHDYYDENYSISTHKSLINSMRIKNDSVNSLAQKYKDVNEEILNNSNILKDRESNNIYFGLDSLDSYLFVPEKFIDKNVIFPRKKMKFENYEFYAPNQPEKYITYQYKNYMELPSKIEIAPDLTERLRQ